LLLLLKVNGKFEPLVSVNHEYSSPIMNPRGQ